MKSSDILVFCWDLANTRMPSGVFRGWVLSDVPLPAGRLVSNFFGMHHIHGEKWACCMQVSFKARLDILSIKQGRTTNRELFRLIQILMG